VRLHPAASAIATTTARTGRPRIAIAPWALSGIAALGVRDRLDFIKIGVTAAERK
jgi:hypothetical protein